MCNRCLTVAVRRRHILSASSGTVGRSSQTCLGTCLESQHGPASPARLHPDVPGGIRCMCNSSGLESVRTACHKCLLALRRKKRKPAAKYQFCAAHSDIVQDLFGRCALSALSYQSRHASFSLICTDRSATQPRSDGSFRQPDERLESEPRRAKYNHRPSD